MDNIALVQEAIDSSKMCGDKGIIVKLDMENVFDCVQHSFIYKLMTKFGFDAKFIKWVSLCISSPWIAPLVNGMVAGFFAASRGLKQGFPLSPFLYIIVSDSLSHMLEHERRNASIQGIIYVKGVRVTNHSQFADDILLLGGA